MVSSHFSSRLVVNVQFRKIHDRFFTTHTLTQLSVYCKVRKIKGSAAHSSRTLLRGGYQIPAKKSRGKAKSFPPAKIVFALPRPNCISSRHTARILRGQNPKKKNVLSILEKITPAKNKRARNIFLFGVAE